MTFLAVLFQYLALFIVTKASLLFNPTLAHYKLSWLFLLFLLGIWKQLIISLVIKTAGENIFVWVIEMQHDIIYFGLDSLTFYNLLIHIYTNFSNVKVILENVDATISEFPKQNI